MAAAISVPFEPVRAGAADEDVRLVIHGVTWGRYVVIRELLEGHPGLRMFYLEGTLEIMSPSHRHEREKSMIGRLIEAWALSRRARLDGYGSTTFRKEAKERGAEPDECYAVGPMPEGAKPDIAIEVVLTSGGVDKLEIYPNQDARLSARKSAGRATCAGSLRLGLEDDLVVADDDVELDAGGVVVAQDLGGLAGQGLDHAVVGHGFGGVADEGAGLDVLGVERAGVGLGHAGDR